MLDTTATIELRLGEYLQALNEIAPNGYSFDTTEGKRYTKIVMTYNGGQRSVHSFVEPATGHVLKSAGWERPAKHVRFDLSDDASFERLMTALRNTHAWSGGYLYIR